MRIILDQHDYERLNHIAQDADISIKGLIETYETIMEANFEQDIWDVAYENQDQIKKDYGEYQENENEK